ncbi:DNA-directed DNA polymerase II large subunit [Methanolacinia paynteri]|uniref:DNA-directed DNA polymerase II large subunit n=1 Tax=Methanolacinia paynteri TaxID=230356 RepID=UPI00064EB1FF|nr:DNA-directed DNA polymerase II large subunit [Methanolacinia paynteri]
MQTSPEMDAYFKSLQTGLETAIKVAKQARLKGIDPRTIVEIPIANDLADRVEALLDIKGVAARLRELGETMSREEVALKIGDDFIAKKFGEQTREEILDHAIRTSMALLTEGVVAAPTEGIGKIGVGRNDDGTEYLKIYYAGPIRSAGGTAQALSVLVGDYVRKGLGMSAFIPRDEEVERYVEEIKKYNNIMSLQYLPPDDDLRYIVRNCPVCVEGEPTEKVEVSGFRNLERIETNVVRGGMALVVAEGMGLKAPKIQKVVRKVKMEGWEWLDKLVSGGTSSAGKEEKKEEDEGFHLKPKDKYIKDLIGGRPVFSYPMKAGGFRLRYGRSRNTGFAAAGFNPSTLHILGDFLAVGTQMKVERPGKAAGVVPVDTVEGPTVRLKNGDVMRIDTIEDALKYGPQVERIIDVGEMLVSYGEFLENNHNLVPSAYCHEWWMLEGGEKRPESAMEAVEMAVSGAYLHPDYTYIWDDISGEDVVALADAVSAEGEIKEGALYLPGDFQLKSTLEILLLPHKVRDGKIVIESPIVFLACLGLTMNLEKRENREHLPECKNGLEAASYLSGFKMRSKAGTRIGGRMGRPGKSKPRKMNPPPNGLFPVGDEGGSRRSFQEASKSKENRQGGLITAEMGLRRCPSCKKITYKNICECGTHTEPEYVCPKCGRNVVGGKCPVCGMEGVCSQQVQIDVKGEYDSALKNLGMIRDLEPKLVKGVKGMMSKERCAEPLEKAVLRAAKELYVFKDGTLRYDMIDLPLTHFKPKEIGTSVERLIELGYPKDVYGKPLESEDQVLELKCQDILVSEDCGEWLLKVAMFIDEMLGKLYDLPPYYNAEKKEDIVGRLLMGLAPHTSAGVLVRLLGFSKAFVGYGHPYFHAAKRRNCFQGETEIMIYDNEKWQTLPIRKFVLENFDISKTNFDLVGTYYSDPSKTFWVHSLDISGAVRMRRVTSVSVHRSPKTLIRFETSRGRSVTVTPEHTMLVCDLAYQRRVKALELKEGDFVPIFEGTCMINDRIVGREILESAEDYVFCLTVDQDHNLPANGIFTGQCDGDEDCVMLLLDGLINFSKCFLPETRGGSMDAPLVLTSRIDPSEVDGECHNVDACPSYPLELYLEALKYTHPKDLEKKIDHVALRLGTPGQYEGIMFTHDTTDISAGPLISSYNTLKTMTDKLEAELELGKIIRAVDADDVAERVLNTHFIRDIMGNLNSFSKQSMRCTKCNAKYRRMPLSGKCRCGNKVIPTVHEGSVKKYLEMSQKMCDEYNVSEYTRQRVEVLSMAVLSTFGEPPEKQMGLADFM